MEFIFYNSQSEEEVEHARNLSDDEREFSEEERDFVSPEYESKSGHVILESPSQMRSQSELQFPTQTKLLPNVPGLFHISQLQDHVLKATGRRELATIPPLVAIEHKKSNRDCLKRPRVSNGLQTAVCMPELPDIQVIS